MASLTVHPDRLLPADPGTRTLARRLYQAVRDLPIVSPHGHVDTAILVDDEPFPVPARRGRPADAGGCRPLPRPREPLHPARPLRDAAAARGRREPGPAGRGRGTAPRGAGPGGVAALVCELAPAARHAGAVLVRQRAG